MSACDMKLSIEVHPMVCIWIRAPCVFFLYYRGASEPGPPHDLWIAAWVAHGGSNDGDTEGEMSSFTCIVQPLEVAGARAVCSMQSMACDLSAWRSSIGFPSDGARRVERKRDRGGAACLACRWHRTPIPTPHACPHAPCPVHSKILKEIRPVITV